jgi:hypothetical protein
MIKVSFLSARLGVVATKAEDPAPVPLARRQVWQARAWIAGSLVVAIIVVILVG